MLYRAEIWLLGEQGERSVVYKSFTGENGALLFWQPAEVKN